MSFINSKQFQDSPFAENANVVYDRIWTALVDGNIQKPVTHIPISRGGVITGSFEVIGIPDNKLGLLPNNDKWAVVYKDLLNFDVRALTGKIKYYDINFDSYLAGEIEVIESKVTSWKTQPMPKEIKRKYNRDGVESRQYCDSNNNGDISFGECWDCF